jgi:L-ascorbate metabolism protein UlaG (beta-lactamase superfamily)
VRLHHLRNAASRLSYADTTFVVDPSLDPARRWEPDTRLANPRRNPLVEVPIPPAAVFAGAAAVLQTHLHRDHVDDTGLAHLPPALPVFCQPADSDELTRRGVSRPEPIADAAKLAGTTIRRVDGRHGFGQVGELLGPSSGFVLHAAGEPTVYLAGDTVWCDVVADTIGRHRPRVIVVNAGGAELASGDRIIMDDADVAQLAAAAPDADIVVVHLEAISHCLTSRADHRHTFRNELHRIHIPEDNDHLELPHQPHHGA